MVHVATRFICIQDSSWCISIRLKTISDEQYTQNATE